MKYWTDIPSAADVPLVVGIIVVGGIVGVGGWIIFRIISKIISIWGDHEGKKPEAE